MSCDSLLRVSSPGKVSTVAVFRRTGLESVPTAVVRGPDGAFYVAELTGYPFPAGQARIHRVVPGHRPTVYATGLTNVVDLAWGPGRRLYALEISHKGLLSGDPTGALVRVGRGAGPHRVLLSDGLRAPAGLAVRGRDAYVTNCGVCAGTGSVLRIRLP